MPPREIIGAFRSSSRTSPIALCRSGRPETPSPARHNLAGHSIRCQSPPKPQEQHRRNLCRWPDVTSSRWTGTTPGPCLCRLGARSSQYLIGQTIVQPIFLSRPYISPRNCGVEGCHRLPNFRAQAAERDLSALLPVRRQGHVAALQLSRISQSAPRQAVA
jgi:hypothetical protein